MADPSVTSFLGQITVGSVSSWLTALFSGGTFIGIVTVWIKSRDGRKAESNRHEEAEDALKNTSTFQMIEAQAAEITLLRKEIREERIRCDEELNKMRATIEGLHSKLIMLSRYQAIPLMGDDAHPVANAAAKRLIDGPELPSAMEAELRKMGE